MTGCALDQQSMLDSVDEDWNSFQIPELGSGNADDESPGKSKAAGRGGKAGQGRGQGKKKSGGEDKSCKAVKKWPPMSKLRGL